MPPVNAYEPEQVHLKLGEAFYDVVTPARFPAQILRYRNQNWAARIGLDGLSEAAWLGHFARFEPLPGSFTEPLALRYHGHQFRSYNPELGDGRGFLFAQSRDQVDHRLLDLGTKGSGPTPWSRRGDGRLTLKGGVREVLASEMLEALGVTTSKSFSLIETGEGLMRHDEPSPTRSSVLVRLSHSHIRIGTFQRLAYHQDKANLSHLLQHVITHYMPEIAQGSEADCAIAFLGEVSRRSARLAAQWMAAGFVHGVLNSDNINVTGESFDYGPWRFVPSYDPGFVAAYYDETGLYAFGQQPSAVAWNMARLAECLIPLADTPSLRKGLEGFGPQLQQAFAEEILRRLGLQSAGKAQDAALAAAWVAFLNQTKAPFEQAFFDWYGGELSHERARRSPSARFYDMEAFAPVLAHFKEHMALSNLRLDADYFQRSAPCTMLIDELEGIWDRIATEDDWSAFEAKIRDIAAMREAYRPDLAASI